MVLNDARDMKVEETGIKYLLLNGKIIWPPPAVNDTGFLKYYVANIDKMFKTSYIVDPLAPYDSTINDFSFLGPDSGQTIYTDPKDQFTKYSSSNIAQEFNAFPATGLRDNIDLLYNNLNIIPSFGTEYVTTPGDFDAAIDGYTFLGPDSGQVIYINPKDQFTKYNSANIAQEFNSFPAVGLYDEELIYNNLNIIPSFGTEYVTTPGDFDAAIDGYTFLGPDTGQIVYTDPKDQFAKYDSYNIAQEFNSIPATGLYDEDILYNNSNIIPSFGTEYVTTPGDFDISLNVYSFLGPNAGVDINTIETDQVVKYDSGNIYDEFNNGPITGYFDQDLVYSFSNIEINFLP